MLIELATVVLLTREVQRNIDMWPMNYPAGHGGSTRQRTSVPALATFSLQRRRLRPNGNIYLCNPGPRSWYTLVSAPPRFALSSRLLLSSVVSTFLRNFCIFSSVYYFRSYHCEVLCETFLSSLRIPFSQFLPHRDQNFLANFVSKATREDMQLK